MEIINYLTLKAFSDKLRPFMIKSIKTPFYLLEIKMIDKIKKFLLTPIKVTYKKRADYSPIENFILNPIILALLVFLVTFQAFSLNDEPQPTKSDTALSNAMMYFERGDFDNAVLQLENVVDNYSGSKAAHQAKFYLGRTAFINGNNDKALVFLSESVSKVRYDNLKKEGYIMLAELKNDVKMFKTMSRACSFFCSFRAKN